MGICHGLRHSDTHGPGKNAEGQPVGMALQKEGRGNLLLQPVAKGVGILREVRILHGTSILRMGFQNSSASVGIDEISFK